MTTLVKGTHILSLS